MLLFIATGSNQTENKKIHTFYGLGHSISAAISHNMPVCTQDVTAKTAVAGETESATWGGDKGH